MHRRTGPREHKVFLTFLNSPTVRVKPFNKTLSLQYMASTFEFTTLEANNLVVNGSRIFMYFEDMPKSSELANACACSSLFFHFPLSQLLGFSTLCYLKHKTIGNEDCGASLGDLPLVQDMKFPFE